MGGLPALRHNRFPKGRIFMEFFSDWLSQTVGTFLALAPWLMLGLFLAGVLHVLFPHGLVARVLGKKGFFSVLWATLVGVPTPLCSCAVIPTGIGLKREGASDGAAVGFLISTPQEGVNSFLVAAAFLGWPFAIFRVFAAMATGMIGGLLTNFFGGKGVEPPPKTASMKGLAAHRRVGEMFRFAFVDLMRDIYLWIAVGVVLAGFIGAALGDMEGFQALHGLGGMLLTLFVALPLYVCSVSSVPVAAALVATGVLPAGAALVFLMAGPATNVATVGAVLKSFGRRITAIYLLTVAVASITFGLVFDWVIPAAAAEEAAHVHHHHAHWIVIASAIALAALMAGHFLAPLVAKVRRIRRKEKVMETSELKMSVVGMTCGNCVRHVQKALESVPGVAAAEVDLDSETATVKGENLEPQALAAAVRVAGYDVD